MFPFDVVTQFFCYYCMPPVVRVRRGQFEWQILGDRVLYLGGSGTSPCKTPFLTFAVVTLQITLIANYQQRQRREETITIRMAITISPLPSRELLTRTMIHFTRQSKTVSTAGEEPKWKEAKACLQRIKLALETRKF